MPFSKGSVSQGDKAKIYVLCVLVVVTACFSLFLTKPGHLIGDESVYHVMARSFAQFGSLDLLNGYEEFPSAELVFPVSHERAGRLVPQYPYLSAVLAAPFYALSGYKGLFILNAIAYLGVLWLCFALAQRLFQDRSLSLNACLIFVLATYAWEYSQAAWPHAVSMLIVASALYLAVRAHTAEDRWRAVAFAAAAGAVVGLGAGVRIDVVFALPALILPFLFGTSLRFREAIAVGLSTIPGLALLGATNYAKFGIASPFSYGPTVPGASTNPASYIPVAVLAVVAVAVLWCLTRPRAYAVLRRRWMAASSCLIAVGAALLLVPDVWALSARLGHGLYQLVVDLRVRDPGIIEGGLTRGPGGGMIYMGSLKKSLLQSCPYLVLLIVPLAVLLRREKDAAPLSILFWVPLAFIGVFGYFAWHGGYSLNLRYFAPILPVTSILAAYSWREVRGRQGSDTRPLVYPTVIFAAAIFVGVGFLPLYGISLGAQEHLLLSFPMVLSGGLLFLLLAWIMSSDRARAALARPVTTGLMFAFVWSGSVAFAYDSPRTWAMRSVSYARFTTLAPVVSTDSIVFVDYATPFSGLYELDRVRLAQVTWDEFRGFRSLLDYHLDRERPVYAWFRPEVWQELRARGLLDTLSITPLVDVAGQPFSQLKRLPLAARAPDGGD